VHSYEKALLLGHYELLLKLKVKHIPKLDQPIIRGTCYLIVLVEGVDLVLFFLYVEFTRGDVFEVKAADVLLGVVARL